MTEQEQRIAIAEACGWKWFWPTHGVGLCGIHGCTAQHWEVFRNGKLHGVYHDDEVPSATPDYLNDLNAMHEAEKTLSDTELDRYITYLYDRAQELAGKTPWGKYAVCADAAQRAKAFCEIIKARKL